MSGPRAAEPLVSIIVPVLDEAANVDALVARLDPIEQLNPGFRFEMIVVDDGSTDDTVAMLRPHVASRSDLSVVVLSRNFGSHYAISAGLAAASGDCAVVIGGDLQEPPELVTSFLERWSAGYDIVWGLRERRVDQGLFARLFSAGFSRLLVRHSEIKTYPAEGPSGFLVDRRVIDVVAAMPERNRNVLGLMAWSGFEQSRVRYEQQERAAGETKWNASKRTKLAVDSFVQFSFMPIRFMTYSGLIIAALGFAYALFLVLYRLFATTVTEGWTTVVVIVLILGGFQLVMLGVLGEYLWRSTDEARRRPLFIVEERIGPGPSREGGGAVADHP